MRNVKANPVTATAIMAMIVVAMNCSAAEPAASASAPGAAPVAVDPLLEKLMRLPVPAAVDALITRSSVRPDDEDGNAEVQEGRIVIDGTRWYARLTNPKDAGWLLIVRGNQRVWDESERLHVGEEPTKKRHPVGQDRQHQDRQMAMVRRDLRALSADFSLSASVLSATAPMAASAAYRVRMVPIDRMVIRDWKRVELDLDASGAVVRAAIDELGGKRSTISVRSATYAATTSDFAIATAPLFVGLDDAR